MNGVQIKGKLLSFDNFIILVEVEKKQNLIYKHAVSTIVPIRPMQYWEEGEQIYKLNDEKTGKFFYNNSVILDMETCLNGKSQECTIPFIEYLFDEYLKLLE